MLLSDADVIRTLGERYVLCWQSVRSAPKVTIDFGEGRVLERTLKGNTVFYLCRENGRVLDAFPGVYTPSDFLAELKKAEPLLSLRDSDVTKTHQLLAPREAATEPMATTLTKAVVESPLLDGADRPGTLAAQTRFIRYANQLRDLSHRPMTPDEAARLAPPGPGPAGERIVALDSQHNVRFVRPAVHLLLGTCYPRLPWPTDCRMAIFKKLLGVPLDDPFLGLAQTGVPGTP